MHTLSTTLAGVLTALLSEPTLDKEASDLELESVDTDAGDHAASELAREAFEQLNTLVTQEDGRLDTGG